jgi:hypothetical protein
MHDINKTTTWLYYTGSGKPQALVSTVIVNELCVLQTPCGKSNSKGVGEWMMSVGLRCRVFAEV